MNEKSRANYSVYHNTITNDNQRINQSVKQSINQSIIKRTSNKWITHRLLRMRRPPATLSIPISKLRCLSFVFFWLKLYKNIF